MDLDFVKSGAFSLFRRTAARYNAPLEKLGKNKHE